MSKKILILSLGVLILSLPTFAQKAKQTNRTTAGKWVRKVERDPISGERSTLVSVTSTNSVSVFGRTGRGKLTVTSYETMPGVIVDTFGRMPPGKFPDIEWWCGESEPQKSGMWVRDKDLSTVVTLPFANELIECMSQSQQFSIRFKAIDKETHTLTFDVRGLAAHANFLEMKIGNSK